MRVAVADDSAVARRLLRQAIKRFLPDALIDEFGDGIALCNGLQKASYRLVFCDVYMPGMTGPDSLVASRAAGIDCLWIFMSVDMSRELLASVQKLGAFEFLPKPFTSDEVGAILQCYRRLSEPTQVLLVDDSRTVRRIIEKVFQRCRFDITLVEADSGEQAIALCGGHSFSLVFMDANMPGLSGFETMTAMRDLLPDCKFVLISSEDKASIMLRAGAFDLDGFLPKPFLPGDVDVVLYRLFGLKAPQLALQRVGLDA